MKSPDRRRICDFFIVWPPNTFGVTPSFRRTFLCLGAAVEASSGLFGGHQSIKANLGESWHINGRRTLAIDVLELELSQTLKGSSDTFRAAADPRGSTFGSQWPFGNVSLFPQIRTSFCLKKRWQLFTPSSSATAPSPAIAGTSNATPSTGSAPSSLPAKCSSWAGWTTLTLPTTGTAWTEHGSYLKGRPRRCSCWTSSTWPRRTRGFTRASWRTGRTQKCGSLGSFCCREVCREAEAFGSKSTCLIGSSVKEFMKGSVEWFKLEEWAPEALYSHHNAASKV